MKAALILLAVAATAAAGEPTDDEARVEQLIHRPTTTAAKPAPPAPARSRAAPPPETALVGQRVRVRTTDRGFYAGTLLSADAAQVTLRIDLPGRALSYALPRGGIAAIEAAP